MRVKGLIAAVGVIIALVIVLVLLRMHFNKRSQTLAGKIVCTYKPFRLSIYKGRDGEGDDKNFSYTISESGEPIYYKESDSNGISITHAENGADIMVSEYETNGAIRRRFVNFYYPSTSRLHYMYFDTNGDGVFDIMNAYDKEGNRTGSFVCSNLCWIPSGIGLSSRVEK